LSTRSVFVFRIGASVGNFERAALVEAVEFAIYTGWDAVLVTSPPRCVIALSRDDVIKVQSWHDLPALSQALNRQGISQSDFHAP
jgi:hypothetical protein